MELSIKSLVLLCSILGTGLTAGLCFTWMNAVTPGIGKLDDMTFLNSFQSMNRVIINPTFILVFFSPVILLAWNAYLSRNADSNQFICYLIAAILFFFGVAIVTIFKNVPLNEMLNNVALENTTNSELSNLRATFEQPWNRWHLVRVITSFSSFLSVLIGALLIK